LPQKLLPTLQQKRSARPSGPVLSVPVGSPVRFDSFGQYGTAKFNARFEIQGAYHYGYLTHNPESDASYGALQLTFDPDLSYVAKLPFWQGFQKPTHIEISNPGDFARALIAPGVTEKLRRKEIFSVSGRARIRVTDYKTWLECDYSHYSFRFVAVLQPRPVRLAQSLVRAYGC
jgi:hypothetical protein